MDEPRNYRRMELEQRRGKLRSCMLGLLFLFLLALAFAFLVALASV